MKQTKVNPVLREYVESEILPRYQKFDKAHNTDHALTVIERSLQLATHYDVVTDLVYTIAAFHDTGLCEGRDTHHTASARIVREDKFLARLFSTEEIETIADAVEDHRASNKQPPRTIYGKIVAEADRLIDGETIVRRTVLYGLAHYPTLSREQHFTRTLAHLREKYGRGGYLRLWLPESPNAERLRVFQDTIENEQAILALFDKFFDEESKT